jgi:hypothetical protein
MKYAITGHTQGIGKGIFDRLSPNCLGFSTTNGYDITRKIDRSNIIKQVQDCDVFINNASDSMGQTLMLIDLFYEWKDLNKVIINVGSRIAEYKEPIWESKLLAYQAEKIMLKEMSLKLKDVSNCKIEYKWFGYVGTEKILSKYPHFKYPEDYISIDEAADLILNF